MNRYDRQQLVDGWNQDRLAGSRVALIGEGLLADCLAMTMAALGFGCLDIYYPTANATTQPYGQDGFATKLTGKRSGLEAIAELSGRINPLVKIYQASLDMGLMGNIRVVGKPDLIIDATNNPSSKLNALEFSASQSIPLASLAAGEHVSSMGIFRPGTEIPEREKFLKNLMYPDFAGMQQGIVPCLVMAGSCAEEARKIVMPLRNERPLDDLLVYSLLSHERFDWSAGERPGDNPLKGKRVLMVGAGALGNFAGIGFALSGVGELQIVDFDSVEETNLNRQVLFYDAVGLKKAEALTQKLRAISPESRISATDMRLGPEAEGMFRTGGYDLVVDCVDNSKTRALINYFSLKYRLPFISGGTRYNSGQATVSVPGKTGCLNCQAGVDQKALAAYRPTSCIYAPEPSVINSNEIVGGLMVGEAISLMSGMEPAGKILKYASQEELRLGTIPGSEPCGCYHDNEMLAGWMGRMMHLYT